MFLVTRWRTLTDFFQQVMLCISSIWKRGVFQASIWFTANDWCIYPGLSLLSSILLLLTALIQWTIIPTPGSSKSIRLAMEDRNEETWWLFYLHVRKKHNNLYYITINKWQQLLDPKKKLLFSRYIRLQGLLLKNFFCYLKSTDFIVVFKFFFCNTFEGDNSTIF